LPYRKKQPENPVVTTARDGTPTTGEDARLSHLPTFVPHEPMEDGDDDILADIEALYRE
jgi:hypothetical protein